MVLQITKILTFAKALFHQANDSQRFKNVSLETCNLNYVHNEKIDGAVTISITASESMPVQRIA